MLLAASVVFTYYTTWAMILVCPANYVNVRLLTRCQPFLDSSSSIHNLFPPREWAIRVPAFILVIGLTAIGLFVGNTLVQENRKKAQKARARTA
jgi:dolichol phosphate-mannose biosynthesis regulatory protein